MAFLTVVFGAIVGFSLGLTGGGGALFAIPLLVYGLGVDPREAVGISLAAVGATSAIGLAGRWKAKQVELQTGLLFAAAGMLGAPLGSWLSAQISEKLLLTMFAILMLLLAVRMWFKADQSVVKVICVQDDETEGPTCRRDSEGVLRLSSPCALLLIIVGVLTGVLSGLFGVGGGFVIVPALVLFSGMPIHRAVGTSLLVITFVSISGVASHLWAGRDISWEVTSLFLVGGILGMFGGIWASRYLSGASLQRVFAIAIVLVAIFVIGRTTFPI